MNEKQKTVGVACPLMETIAVKIEKSIRTVRRSVARLEQLGIIKRVFTKERHKRGGIAGLFCIIHLKVKKEKSHAFEA